MSTVPVGAIASNLDIVDHHRFGLGYPHDDWNVLRHEAPICKMNIPGWEPFWALTTPEPIRTVSSRPEVFQNAPSLHVRGRTSSPTEGFRSIINMDPPDHRRYRQVLVRHLGPGFIAAMRPGVEAAASSLLTAILRDEPADCDFVEAFAEQLPFLVIADAVGLPEADRPAVHKMMNGVLLGTLPSLMAYMEALALQRRQHPRNDLASILSTARLQGELLATTELVSYYCSLTSAAHGTVRNALSGAVLAFAEHPEEFTRLRNDRSLLDNAVEEVLRWTTPIVGFARTAAMSTDLDGHRIESGDRLLLVYGSANRDAPTFGDPFSFRIDRDPNPHLSFGIGEHFCLGARLARLELNVFLDILATNVENIEITGPIERYQSSLLSGVSRLPVRFYHPIRPSPAD